jgi:hypothetical protein
MAKYANWPNLRLTYVVTSDKTDYWGLPEVVMVSYPQVCKRSFLALQNAQRLCLAATKEKFPEAQSIECVNVQWLPAPRPSRKEPQEPTNAQLDFPF